VFIIVASNERKLVRVGFVANLDEELLLLAKARILGLFAFLLLL